MTDDEGNSVSGCFYCEKMLYVFICKDCICAGPPTPHCSYHQVDHGIRQLKHGGKVPVTSGQCVSIHHTLTHMSVPIS